MGTFFTLLCHLPCVQVYYTTFLVPGKSGRERSDGRARWYNAVIGGVKPDGTDASNELTMHIMQALINIPTPHHTISLAVAESTPKEVMLKAVECQASGLSMPAFVSDNSYTDFFHKYWGMPIEDARKWAICGCLDGVVAGKTNRCSCYMANLPLWLLGWLNHGVDAATGVKAGPDVDIASFKTFEEAYQSFVKDCLHYHQPQIAQRSALEMYIMREMYPRTMLAALLDGECIKKGMALFDNWNAYDINSFNPAGMINVAESMYAIKKLVFEEKCITLPELKKALDANWEGYEDLRSKVLAIPHYGNNVDEIDQMVARLYSDWAEGFANIPSDKGRKWGATAVSITSYDPLGRACGATPDGRMNCDVLADGCASPKPGAAKSGFLSAIQSAMKINQDQYSAFLLNQKFNKDALKTEADRNKLADAIKVYLTNGGKHIQFVVSNRETLLAAQANPKDYGDLMVRVAGYSTYFTWLSPRVQNQVIDRTTYTNV